MEFLSNLALLIVRSVTRLEDVGEMLDTDRVAIRQRETRFMRSCDPEGATLAERSALREALREACREAWAEQIEASKRRHPAFAA